MKRILFVSENVTLAQVVRLATLAKCLDPRDYEVHFACSTFDPMVFGDARFALHELHSLPRQRIDRALASGKRLYEKRDLAAYVRADRALIEQVKPQLIVGDFRLSLAVSAPLTGVPFATLINAYWSPYAQRDGWPLPEHPIVELLGVELAAKYFPIALPKVFSHFAKPVNEVRRQHGLRPIGSLPEVLSFGDFVLHPDIPEIVPSENHPSTHVYLGHVPWSPDVPLPSLEGLDPARPLIYVTLGSSGKTDCLPLVLSTLASLPVNVLLSTAGRHLSLHLPDHMRVASYVPGDRAAERAALVISNGGASTAYQALAAGRPTIGIAYNLDQYLAMTAIEKTGAGVLLRSGTLTRDGLARTVTQLVGSESAGQAARRVAQAMARYDYAQRFTTFVAAVTSMRAAAP